MPDGKVRVYELSKELGIPNKTVIALINKQFGLDIKSHSSSIDQSVADAVVAKVKEATEKQGIKSKPAAKPAAKAEAKPTAKAKPETAKKPVEKKKPTPKVAEAKKPAPKKPESEQKTTTTPKAKAPEKAAEAPIAKSAEKPAAKTKSKVAQKTEKPTAKAETKQPEPKSEKKPQEKPAAPQPEAKSDDAPIEKASKKGKKKGAEDEEEEIKIVTINSQLTVRELSQLLEMKETDIIKHVFMKGTMITVNQTLEPEYATQVAEELGFLVDDDADKGHEGEYSSTEILEKRKVLDEKQYKNLEKRAPVISIMGHVDHGKTSLLDAIRETRTNVAGTEAGGITQSIGAYTVDKDGQKIVFLDTPGHEAFTAMRMRGAHSTDIAILVVAADDGVMPQTMEAINHAKAAQIPIIVAVNKIDKADADPDVVIAQLAEHGLTSEKWGGDTVTVEVSALQKLGLEDLLENIIVVSELLDLQADSTVPAEGIIVESKLDKQKGAVATALVQNGTMEVGDNILIGHVGGRVRALLDDYGNRIDLAGPATPVEILGLNDVPNAGESFKVIKNNKDFKQQLNEAKESLKEEKYTRSMYQGLTGLQAEEQELQQDFNLIVKADTQGSMEAITESLLNLSTDEITVKIIHSGTGNVSEADVMLASASGALIVCFNVGTDGKANAVAEDNEVSIRHYDVIYHMTEEIEKMMLGQLSPDIIEVEIGQAEIRQIFTAGKNKIAGCMVTSGKILRNNKGILLRDGQELFAGSIESLKRHKDDVKEVAEGFECGISFGKAFNEIEEGDIIVCYSREEKKRTSLEVAKKDKAKTKDKAKETV